MLVGSVLLLVPLLVVIYTAMSSLWMTSRFLFHHTPYALWIGFRAHSAGLNTWLYRTEKTYGLWVLRILFRFHSRRHPERWAAGGCVDAWFSLSWLMSATWRSTPRKRAQRGGLFISANSLGATLGEPAIQQDQ